MLHNFVHAYYIGLAVIDINQWSRSSWTKHPVFKEEIHCNTILTQYYVYLDAPAAERVLLPSCRSFHKADDSCDASSDATFADDPNRAS